MLEGFAWQDNPDRSILSDFSAYAVAIAIGAFILMEQTVEWRLPILLRHMEQTVVRDGSTAFEQALKSMQRRSGSGIGELLIALAAFVLADALLRRGISAAPGGTWFGHAHAGGITLTWAGWWAALFGMPLYWFLLGRWLWRFGTWALFLRDVSRCQLKLVASHPDRCGGLAFICQFPASFALLVFAESTVVSAVMLRMIVHGDADLTGFKFAFIGLLFFFVVVLLLPLLVFTPRLIALKRQALAEYGLLATKQNLDFHSKWIDAARHQTAGSLLGSADPGSMEDLSASYGRVKRMVSFPVTREGIVPLMGAALLPAACAAATQVPAAELLKAVKPLLMM